jgi:hypothetical protein
MITHHPKLTEAYPHYDSSLLRAAQRAHQNCAEFTVYYDGVAMYVRAVEAAPPPSSIRVCVAGRWDAKTVQLRFNGGHSEWVHF